MRLSEETGMSKLEVKCGRCGFRAFLGNLEEAADWQIPIQVAQPTLCPACLHDFKKMAIAIVSRTLGKGAR